MQTNASPVRVTHDRLDALLGPLRGLLTPWGPLIAGVLGWAITAPFSSAPLAIGLCWWGMALLLWSIQIERPWLNVLPFPPLTVLALHLFLRWELGGLLLLLGPRGTGDIDVWSKHVAQALPINAIFTTALVGIGAVNWCWIRKSPAPSMACQTSNGESRGIESKTLLLLAAATGLIAVGYAFVGYFGGTLDRGPTYLQWAGKLWRPDTLFSATIRLRDLYFILLPLVVWLWRRSWIIEAAFLIPTAASLLLTAILGGRGLLLYPAVLLLSGLWLAGANAKLIRTLVTAIAALAILVTAVFPSLRNSTAFQNTSKADIGSRINLLQKTALSLNPFQSLTEIGRDLYAWSDPYLFQEPGLSQPPAGNQRLGNLIHVWTPRALMPNRPEINDGHLIVKEIMGKPNAGVHEGRHIWFPGISFGADLYWRYRWPGVLIGSIVFGSFYALLCRFWYRMADLNRSTWSLLIALYPSTFLQGPPLRSVSETAWNWLYEFPKYLAILIVLALIVESLRKLWRNQAHS